MKEEVLSVEGMTCNHCKMTVENTVVSLSGVGIAEVDLKAKTLTVSFDEAKVDQNQIRTAVESQGYHVV